MSARNSIFAWSERGAVNNTQLALEVAGVLPKAGDWRVFLDRLLLWSGAIALAAAAVFFIAYNWQDLGKFAKFGLAELLVVAAIFGYFGPWALIARRERPYSWSPPSWSVRCSSCSGKPIKPAPIAGSCLQPGGL
jgi:uncharacterized membrane protein